ncbi:MAG: dockerin type I domain-containing protein [Flavobacteriales bacterium]|nr:dockerin type I domain-containing protein [Flavobacteriales bacterium]
MKKLFLLFFLPVTLSGQTSNYELVFNSTSFSYVDIPNVSSVIANKTAFSISGWVNPQSDVSHSGFFGFRNNTDADFYLLQLTNTNNIEARFRNSSGIAYDIIANNALDFNQWQHLALTYDGSYIRLYKDGSLVDSTAANGIIAQNFDSFKLGALDYQGTLFHMIGNLDEIRLWDVALSANEINNWMCVEVDSTHPNYVNLMGYWNLNEGIGSYTDDQTANGNNGTLFGGTTWQASSSCLSGAILCGDVNEDGVVDQTDVTEINNFILGSPPLVFNSWAADVNCDGTINILDITMLNSFISGTGSLNCCSTTTPQTYVPDNNFEAYLEINGMGNGIPYDDSVFTSAIDTLTYLDISFGAGSATGIFDLTGIEDFNNLLILECSFNNLTSIDMSNNISLIELNVSQNQIIQLNVSSNAFLKNLNCAANQLQLISVVNNQMLTNFQCQQNQLTSLDLSNNIMLDSLACLANQLTNLDLSNNINLIALACGANQLTTLNISNNINLQGINCDDNDLVSLDLRNGSNQQLGLSCTHNLQLSCIEVDDVAWSTANWTVANGNIDPQHYFSTNCSGTGIEESPTNKDLLRKIDVLGRETKGTKDELLIYIYDDETVEKKIIIE